MTDHPKNAVAMTMLVIIDTAGEHGSREVYSYFSSLEDAIVSAIAMVEARGWRMPQHVRRDEFTVAEAERIQAYMAERGHDTPRGVSAAVYMPEVLDDGTVTEWIDFDRHMGAIYACELRAANVTAGAASTK